MAASRSLLVFAGLAAAAALQSSSEARLGDGPTASFLPDAKHLCIEGDTGYLVKFLESLRSSPLQSHYTESEIALQSCAERGYKQGPTPGKCFKETTNWFDGKEHARPSEEEAFALYAEANGITLKKAMLSMGKYCQNKKKQPKRPWLSTTVPPAAAAKGAAPAAARAPAAPAAPAWPAAPTPVAFWGMGPPVAYWGMPFWR
mmetsp:Transcript_104033/g.315704  ORF Transcript_104033/g.315704 Transcript_104033/m.315704 type:complete len:202 (-) Transcript_104033:11-616(-)